jgi:uncharacterized protein (UPF0276 family)
VRREPSAPRDGDRSDPCGGNGAASRGAGILLGGRLRRRGEGALGVVAGWTDGADGGRRLGLRGGARLGRSRRERACLGRGSRSARDRGRVVFGAVARRCARHRAYVRCGARDRGRCASRGARSQARGEDCGETCEEHRLESRRRSQLRRRDVRERREEENLVIASARRAVRGVGLGLRWEFLDELLERESNGDVGRAGGIDFLEITPENYLQRGGRYREALHTLAARYPFVTHGLTLSLGGPDPLDEAYLSDLKAFLGTFETPWHSDHLCIGAVDGRAVHDLLPVSHKAASVVRIADRIRAAQDRLGLPLAIENISYYWHPGRAEMGEAEFLSRVCDAADCGFLLDVNNAYVNAVNFGTDLGVWIREAPLERAVQIHVAGHEWFRAGAGGLGEACAAGTPGALIVDTHGAEAPDPVLELLERVLPVTGPVPIVLERDQNIPPLADLLREVERIRVACLRARGAAGGGPKSQISAIPR